MATTPNDNAASGAPPSKSRLIAGCAILAFWPLSKIVGTIIVLVSSLTTGNKAILIAVLFSVIPKISLIGAAMVLGKEGFVWVKAKIVVYLAPIAPPKNVSRRRYRIGLVMFTLPFLVGWSFSFTSDVSAGVPKLVYLMSWLSDLVLLASLFVLSGTFWNKLQSLFIRTDLADFGEATSPSTGTTNRGRLMVAIGFVVIGLIGLVSPPIIAESDLATDWKIQLYGWAAFSPILMFVAAALILRRNKAARLLAKLERALPEIVSAPRHYVGLLLIAIPIVFCFLIPHLANAVPLYATNALIFGFAINVVLIIGLFVVGTGFWGKLEALYVQDATVQSDTPTAPGSANGSAFSR